jgi:phospholipid transport system substrate-binding protein
MITRRGFLASLALSGVYSGVMSWPAQAAADHASVVYMRQVGRDLLNAHRQGTISAFLRAVQRHADIASIASYGLGSYGSKLPASMRSRYNRGVATYISRYFALESRSYPVAKFEIGQATVDKDKNVSVASKIFLLNGQVFNVTWSLAWRGGAYKVKDVRVVGFSMTYLLKGQIVGFLDKRDGNFALLVKALGG